MDKNKFAAQLDELRRAADNEARNRNAAETKITSLERNIKTLTVEIEELRQIKINLEGSIEKWKQENGDWKKKYENEARLRVEDVDVLKKKFTVEVNGLTDMVHQLEQKLKAAENAKSKLSGEVNVLIKDFEHSQVVIKEMTAKFQSSEKSNIDLSAKLKEMTNLYEKADKDSKFRAGEIVKLGNEMDRLKMPNETLTRDRGVLNDEVKSLKMELDALKKRMSDMDRDNRKLSHEREELARAYKDADAGKQKALDRVAVLEKELAKMKAEFEKKFGGARDEFETMKKKLVEEINILTRKLTDSENRLKVEVEGIKKKMAITITELEMSLDASNKSNSQLQNTTKIQAQRIMKVRLEDSTNRSEILHLPTTVLDNSRSKLRRNLLLSPEITKILPRNLSLLMTVPIRLVRMLVTLRVFSGKSRPRWLKLILPRRLWRMKSEASVSRLRKLRPTLLPQARGQSRRWKSVSKSLRS